MKITGKVFFRSITIKNKELIPPKGPIMILANHPSSFMDPIMIATLLNYQVYFLAKAELFKGKFARWILPKFNVIPIYRKQDDPALMDKNEETFVKCFEHLEKGGAILIFPEGTSITERKLRPIKTGAARIILGTEARNNFQLNSQMLTIGLNYANPHKFNLDLFITVDTPIQTVDYKDKYALDPIKTVQELTETIRIKLEKQVIGMRDDRTDKLAHDIEKIYKYKLSKDLGISRDDKDATFQLSKTIVEVVDYFYENQSERVENMNVRIQEYLGYLNSLGLTDYDIHANQRNDSWIGNGFKALMIVIIGFPFYIFGLLNNYLPFKIPDWIANRAAKTIEFRGPIAMATGMFTFLIFYTFQIILVWKLSFSIGITLAYSVILPSTGLFAYRYSIFIRRIKAKWLLIMIFYKKNNVISGLIIEREQIIALFDKAREDYNLAKNG